MRIVCKRDFSSWMDFGTFGALLCGGTNMFQGISLWGRLRDGIRGQGNWKRTSLNEGYSS